MLRTVEANGNAISYTLERKPVKNINLRIRADQCVYVSAPKDVAAKIFREQICQWRNGQVLRPQLASQNKECIAQ